MDTRTGKRDEMTFNIDMDLLAYDSYDDIEDVIDDIVKACNINTKDSSITQYYDHDKNSLTTEFVTNSDNNIYINVDARFDQDGGPRGISASDYRVKFNEIDKTDDAIAIYKKNTGENDKLLYPFDMWVPDFLKKFEVKAKANNKANIPSEKVTNVKYTAYTKEKGLINTNNYKDFFGLTLHREDGPAFIKYDDNGNVEYEEYWIKKRRHRLDGPAFIRYHRNGKVAAEVYCVNNREHRLDGPAEIQYNEDGTIDKVVYYISNKRLSFEEWQKHPLVKAETIEVDTKKELDALVKKDKEGIKTDDYFISSTGKYPVVYTLKESKVFESFKEVYVNKNKHTINERNDYTWYKIKPNKLAKQFKVYVDENGLDITEDDLQMFLDDVADEYGIQDRIPEELLKDFAAAFNKIGYKEITPEWFE